MFRRRLVIVFEALDSAKRRSPGLMSATELVDVRMSMGGCGADVGCARRGDILRRWVFPAYYI